MDKKLSYIQENITGIWEDRNYSFPLYFNESEEINEASYTNKKIFPKNAAMGKFWIKERVDCYILQIIFFRDGNPVNEMTFRIEDLDATTGRMRLSSNNIQLRLAKVA